MCQAVRKCCILLLCATGFVYQLKMKLPKSGFRAIVVYTFIFTSLSSSLLTALGQNSPPQDTESIAPLHTNREIILSIGTLIFGVIVLGCEVILLRKAAARDSILLIITTLIIIAAIFLVTAGFDSQQLAPAYGLLGAIAGYLLGKGQTGESNPLEKGEEPEEKRKAP